MSARPVARPRLHALEALFGKRRVVIGVTHARPLPGAPDYDEILSVADGVIVASSLKREGVWWHGVGPDRVAALMAEVRRLA